MILCNMSSCGPACRASGVGPRMLAAVKSLYSSGTLSMKVGGTAGQPRVQQNGVRQGCPLSPTLFGIFFDGLDGHLHQHAPHAGVQLDSGRWVSALVYADDDALLSWSSSGLQALLTCMHGYCHGIGLTISPTKTEVIVFNGCTSDTWHVGQHQLPQVASFKYLGFVFHESGSMSPAFERLAHNGKGANARLQAKYKGLMCDKSFPMMRRLFDAVVLPTVSYGCEVWAPACSGTLDPGLKDMLDVQVRFFRQLCHLRKSVTPAIIFREFAERPWLQVWWSQVLGFMRRLSNLPAGKLAFGHSQRQRHRCGAAVCLYQLGQGDCQAVSWAWHALSLHVCRHWGSRQPWFHDQVDSAAAGCLGGPACVPGPTDSVRTRTMSCLCP